MGGRRTLPQALSPMRRPGLHAAQVLGKEHALFLEAQVLETNVLLSMGKHIKVRGVCFTHRKQLALEGPTRQQLQTPLLWRGGTLPLRLSGCSGLT